MQLHYFELYCMKTDRYFLRKKRVAYPRPHGIKAAAPVQTVVRLLSPLPLLEEELFQWTITELCHQGIPVGG